LHHFTSESRLGRKMTPSTISFFIKRTASRMGIRRAFKWKKDISGSRYMRVFFLPRAATEIKRYKRL